MNRRFENHVAVISGGAKGIGKAIAYRLAYEGAKIACFDLDHKALEKTVQELRNSSTEVIGIPVDVSDEPSVIKGYEKVIEQFGGIHIVINAAGIVGPTHTSIFQYETSAFDNLYKVNLKGSFLMAKYGLSHMVHQKYGRVLLLASMAGKDGNPFMVGYTASKAGVIGMVKGLGKEFATHGITVNGLAPAVIKTEMNLNTAPEQLEYMKSLIPMGRLGTVEEVASVACFIVSPENSFSTGFVYDISGGRATY